MKKIVSLVTLAAALCVGSSALFTPPAHARISLSGIERVLKSVFGSFLSDQATQSTQFLQLAQETAAVAEEVQQTINSSKMLINQIKQLKDFAGDKLSFLDDIRGQVKDLLDNSRVVMASFDGLNFATDKLMDRFEKDTLSMKYLSDLQKQQGKDFVLDSSATRQARRSAIVKSQRAVVKLQEQQAHQQRAVADALNKQLDLANNGENEIQVLKSLANMMGQMSNQMTMMNNNLQAMAVATATKESALQNEEAINVQKKNEALAREMNRHPSKMYLFDN